MIVISSPLRHNRETVSLRPLDNGRQSGEDRRSLFRRNHLARCFAFQRADIRTADQPISRPRMDGLDLRFAYKRSGDRFPFWGGGLGTARTPPSGPFGLAGARGIPTVARRNGAFLNCGVATVGSVVARPLETPSGLGLSPSGFPTPSARRIPLRKDLFSRIAQAICVLKNALTAAEGKIAGALSLTSMSTRAEGRDVFCPSFLINPKGKPK